MTLLSSPLPHVEDKPQEDCYQPRLRWKDHFQSVGRGLKIGIRDKSSFFVYVFFAALGAATAIALHCRLIEWCLLALCLTIVLVAELFHSSLEKLCRQTSARKEDMKACLNTAAAAVFLATAVAIVVSGIVFAVRLSVILTAGGQ